MAVQRVRGDGGLTPPAYFAAVHTGLAQWLEDERTTRGKQDARTVLDMRSWELLHEAVACIRANATELTACDVRITSDDIRARGGKPGNVRYRLRARIAEELEPPTELRFISRAVDGGTVLVRPLVREPDGTTMLISALVGRWDDTYGVLRPIAPPEAPVTVPLPPRPGDTDPAQRRAILGAAEALLFSSRGNAPAYRIAQRWYDELRKIVAALWRRVTGRRQRERRFVEVVEYGQVELLVAGETAVGGDTTLAAASTPRIRRKRYEVGRIDLQAVLRDVFGDPDRELQRGVERIMDLTDSYHDVDACPPEQRAAWGERVDAARSCALAAANAVASHLLVRGVISDEAAWIVRQQERAVATVAAEDTSDAAVIQARRRLGKDPGPAPIRYARVAAIARRSDRTEATAVARALTEAAGVLDGLRRVEDLPQPWNLWFDTSIELFLVVEEAWRASTGVSSSGAAAVASDEAGERTDG